MANRKGRDSAACIWTIFLRIFWIILYAWLPSNMRVAIREGSKIGSLTYLWDQCKYHRQPSWREYGVSNTNQLRVAMTTKTKQKQFSPAVKAKHIFLTQCLKGTLSQCESLFVITFNQFIREAVINTRDLRGTVWNCEFFFKLISTYCFTLLPFGIGAHAWIPTSIVEVKMQSLALPR